MSVPPILWIALCARTNIIGEKGNDKEEQGPKQGGEGKDDPM